LKPFRRPATGEVQDLPLRAHAANAFSSVVRGHINQATLVGFAFVEVPSVD